MRILVTFAVEAEFAPWRQSRKFKPVNKDRGNVRLFGTNIEDAAVEVLLTGIGKTACEQTLRELNRLASSPDLVVTSGFAGALREPFGAGDIVVPRRVRTLNNELEALADATAQRSAVGNGAASIETMITVDHVVQTATEKSRLGIFGEAVDMESAIIMSHFAGSAPILCVRAISDTAAEDLPLDFDRCLTPQGAIRPMRLLNQLVSGPDRLPKLIRFGRQSNMAARRLAAFLDNFVSSISIPQEKMAV